MPIVLANQKKAKVLETTRALYNATKYRLFKNDYTPVAGMNAASFTEVTDTGYTTKVPVWAAAVLNAANKGELLAPILTWVFTHAGGNFTVYGYFVTDDADNEVIYAERAAASVLISVAGQTYSVVPKYTRDTA